MWISVTGESRTGTAGIAELKERYDRVRKGLHGIGNELLLTQPDSFNLQPKVTLKCFIVHRDIHKKRNAQARGVRASVSVHFNFFLSAHAGGREKIV